MTSSPSTMPGLSQIGQVAINVRDLDRAVAFYRDTLGLPFLFRVPGMAFLSCGEVRLLLGLAEQPEHDHPASILYYRVADIHASAAALAARGAVQREAPGLVARMPDHDLWLAFFQDSEGNPFALMSEVARS